MTRVTHLGGTIAALILLASPSAGASAATLRQLTYVQIVGNVPLDRQIRAAQQVGVGKVRLAVRWYEVQRQRDQFVWKAPDERIRKVRAAGLVPMIVLFGGSAAYPAPTGVAVGGPSGEEAVAGFARFAADAVKRYGVGTGDTPIFYEIWNEPNTKTFWGRPPEPEAYADMATQACTAIKKAAPAAKVLVLGMEGTPVKAPYFVPAYNLDIYQQWAVRAATPGLMTCADGISMHPYLPLPERHQSLEPQLQRFIAAHWRKPAPPIVANTEWGYTIDTRRGGTAEKQAAMNLRALLIGAGNKRPTNLYQSVNGAGDQSKPDQTFGLVTFSGEIKPAGLAVKRLIEAVGDHEIDGLSVTPGKPDIYRFKAHKGRSRVEIVWTPDAPTSVSAAGAKATDLVTGQSRAVSNGKVPVNSTPVLLSWTT